jgi:hypothetical protein
MKNLKTWASLFSIKGWVAEEFALAAVLMSLALILPAAYMIGVSQ